jgi:hypothetical protein
VQNILLIALLALPLGGAALELIAAQIPRLRPHTWIVMALATLLALVAGWVLRPVRLEAVLGDWTPVSFTGMPLTLSANPAGLSIVIAAAAAMLLTALPRKDDVAPVAAAVAAPAAAPDTSPAAPPGATPAPVASAGIAQGIAPLRWQHISAALVFGSLVLTALSDNLIALVVGIGLTDMAVTLHGVLRGRNTSRILRDGLFHGASLTILVVAVTLYGVSNNSLYFNLAQLPDHLLPFITLALAVRFSLVPIRAAGDLHRDLHWANEGSNVAGLLVLMRLLDLGIPGLRAWFYGLILLTAVITLVLGLLSSSRTFLLGSINVGALGLALAAGATGHSGMVAVATIAWLLGVALLSQPAVAEASLARRARQMARILGAACLAGLPLTVGFVGRAGIVASWIGRDTGGVVLALAFTLATLLLVACLLRAVTHPSAPAPADEATPAVQRIAGWIALALACAHVLIFGLAPALANAPSLGEQLGGNGLSGWLSWLVALGLGFALWWFEPRWDALLNNWHEPIESTLSLNWLQEIVSGALDRLSLPFGRVFVFLESDGALLWAVIVILIVVLVSRSGGP